MGKEGKKLFKNKEGKVRSGWKIVIVLAIALAGSIIGSAILGGVSGALMTASGDMIARSMTDITYTARGESILRIVNTVATLLQEIMFIITPIIAWKLIMKRKLTDMGFPTLKSHAAELMIGLVIGIVSISVVFAAMVLTGQAQVESWTPRFTSSQLIYVFIYICVGFAEEIYTRGFVMSVLRQTKSKLVVVIVSSVLFALMHSANPGIGLLPYINLALFGVFTAYIYIRSGNIWMCIGYHITWNYFQGYVFGFKVSGTNSQGMLTTVFPKDTILNGGAFGPEGGLFVTTVILLGILFVKLFYKNSQFDFMAVDQQSVTPVSLQDTAEDADKQEAVPENTAQ
jgi:membrane protease YdiL (CAAX protease family)